MGAAASSFHRRSPTSPPPLTLLSPLSTGLSPGRANGLRARVLPNDGDETALVDALRLLHVAVLVV